MFEPTEIAWHNGRIVQREQAAPSIASHSLHLGIGVFDGIMAYWNQDHYYLHEIDAHLDRFLTGSQKMELPFLWSKEVLKSGIQELLESLPPHNYYIRPIVYRPGSQIHITGIEEMPVDVAIFGVTAPRNVVKSLVCHLSNYERVSSLAIPIAWKVCGTYVNSYLVRRAAEKAGFNDGIMLDRQGRIAEASAANFFLIQDNKIVTPSLNSDIFPGITRSFLIQQAKGLGIEVIERDIYPQELSEFEATFLVSTLMELKPVERIESFCYDSANHPLFRRLLKVFQDVTSQ